MRRVPRRQVRRARPTGRGAAKLRGLIVPVRRIADNGLERPEGRPHARAARQCRTRTFGSKPAEPIPPWAPDLAYIRKSLNWRLRMVQTAEILPWSEPETESLEKHFPELARYLPADEADAMIAEFAA